MHSLSHIKTFVKVVELNNFSQAAKHLKLTVAAVSKHVSQLENELNVKLLKRTTRRLMLTEIGHQYFIKCKDVISACHEADAIISQSTKEPTGTLNIKSERYFAERFIFPRLKNYQEKYPKVTVSIESAERVPNLIDENFDIVFARSLQETAGIVQKTITNTHFCLCASPVYLEKFGTPVHPKDLINHHYLSHSSRMPTDVLEFGKEQVYIEPILLINDSDALLQCALDDMGIVKLQHYVVSDAIKKGKLIEILTNYPSTPFPIKVFYQPEKYLQTKVNTFVEHICNDLPNTL